MGKKVFSDEKDLRQTLEYLQALHLLRIKNDTSEKLKNINKELNGVNYLSRKAVALAKMDIGRDLLPAQYEQVNLGEVKGVVYRLHNLDSSKSKGNTAKK